MQVFVRWLIRVDMPAVLAIEQASSEYPWSEEEFLAALRQRAVIGNVAEVGDRVVGFVIYELHRGHVKVMNLAVAPDFRRRGVATAMVEKLKGKLHATRPDLIWFVRETQLAGHLFLRSQGVRASGVFPAYHDDGDGAYLFSYSVGEAAALEACTGR